MKKNEYISPEVEVVEITEQCSVLAISTGDAGGTKDPDADLPDFPFPVD